MPKKEKKPKGAKTPAQNPAWIDDRIKIWDELYAKFSTEQAALAAKETPIDVTLPNGKVVQAVAYKTTPMDIAKGISSQMAKQQVVAKVDGKFFDLLRPLEESCDLELCNFDHPDGEYTFWHSSAHMLGQAIELTYPEAKLCIGPPLPEEKGGGFYYDVHMESKVSQVDYKVLQGIISKIRGEKQPFTRLVLSKEEAKRLFADNIFKQEILDKKVEDGAVVTAYRCGPLIDLCRGPHVPNTGVVKALAVTKNSSAYWLGNAENPALQRVYGMSFPDTKKLAAWEELMQQAAERDHRKIGVEQDLFFFDDVSAGSAFFQPHGARIYNGLIEFMRGEYAKRGYVEVLTPNIFACDLWKRSGHWGKYKENMFTFDVEGVDFALKPMNCPGHCIIYGSRKRSYRELPIRMAEFAVLHRNELSGALGGLTRVRRFQQDDAHIFCRHDQIAAEVAGVLDLLKHTYGIFGFTFDLTLSTRPDNFLGELSQWDQAELALAECLDSLGTEWSINEADGAFYGPKIDIQLCDALKRKHQCATIQLDFQNPINFDLKYKADDGSFQRPCVVHRAIFGSVERFISILTEHCGGKWPFFISPRQIMVIPVSEVNFEYAAKVHKTLADAGFYADVNLSKNQFPKKVFEAQNAQYNYAAVVGDEETANGTINLRVRGQTKGLGEKTVAGFVQFLKDEVAQRK